MIELVITTAITSGVSALIGALVAVIVGRVKRGAQASADTQRAIAAGVKTLLRNELVASHREWVEEKGYITLEALEYIDETYACYHDRGGNGSGTRLWEDIHNLPIREHRAGV